MKSGATSAAVAVLAAGVSGACALRGPHPPPAPPLAGVAAARGATGFADSAGPFYVPASLREARFWGALPGGGERAVVAGVRVIARSDGSLAAAVDRLPGSPSEVARVPERLGGGFVYVLGSQLWRSRTWLGEAAPIFAAPSSIEHLFVGLDRMYVRTSPGSLVAIDPRGGQPQDLGPLPSAPHFGQLVALDGWRALAVADLRGALVTADAGASWRPVRLPFVPRDVVALDGAFGVARSDEDRGAQRWLVRPDGRSEPLAGAPDERLDDGAAARVPQDANPASRSDGPNAGARRIFGNSLLAAAVEDGWPLGDGTAMVARDGALARVRISDGVLADFSAGVFAPSPARCHALPLPRPGDAGGFGFVCGEPRGPTWVYAWDRSARALLELRRFDDPRLVMACGNGALVVAGGCAARADSAAGQGRERGERDWCVMSAGRRWSEARLRGPCAQHAQPVVLSDGRLAVLSPPAGGDLATAHLAFGSCGGDGGSAVAVHFPRFPPLEKQEESALRLGTWMSGFEERRPGVLGGWVDANGSLLGVEIDVSGRARAGEYIRDAGTPIVSGRWALGWTASRRGFESIDGGMTWTKDLALPDPIAEPKGDAERACGPIGCAAAGWLRIGWGDRQLPAAAAPRPFRVAPNRRPTGPWHLACEPLATAPPRSGAIARDAARSSSATTVPLSSAISGAWAAVSELPAFSGRAAPQMTSGDLGLVAEGTSGLEVSMRSTPAVRLYAWGPGSGEWETLGRWQVRWDWAWGGWLDSRASAVAASPWPTLDAARRALGIGTATPAAWSIAAGNDADHALLAARRGPIAELLVLEAGRAPRPVRHDGDEEFPDPQSAIYSAGRWFVTTPQPRADPPATVLWAVDGAAARELLRVPRAGFDSRYGSELARRSDGRAIGLAVEGRPDLTKPASLWIAPVDVEAGTFGDPERIGPPGIVRERLCAAAEPGWDLDLPFPGDIELSRPDGWSATLQNATVRLRVSRDDSCVERALGSIDAYASAPADGLTEPDSARSPAPPVPSGVRQSSFSIEVSVFSARTRFPLRCWAL